MLSLSNQQDTDIHLCIVVVHAGCCRNCVGLAQRRNRSCELYVNLFGLRCRWPLRENRMSCYVSWHCKRAATVFILIIRMLVELLSIGNSSYPFSHTGCWDLVLPEFFHSSSTTCLSQIFFFKEFLSNLFLHVHRWWCHDKFLAFDSLHHIATAAQDDLWYGFFSCPYWFTWMSFV